MSSSQFTNIIDAIESLIDKFKRSDFLYIYIRTRLSERPDNIMRAGGGGESGSRSPAGVRWCFWNILCSVSSVRQQQSGVAVEEELGMESIIGCASSSTRHTTSSMLHLLSYHLLGSFQATVFIDLYSLSFV